MRHAEIMGAKVDKISTEEVLEKIKIFLLSDTPHYIVTLNPEMVVEAQKDSYFKKIINEADIAVPDGIGILLASRFINNIKLSEKISGIDLIYKICEADFIKGKKIYLLGAKEGIAEKAKSALLKKYPHLKIVGAEEGIRLEMSNVKCQMSNKFQNSKCNNLFVILNLFQNLRNNAKNNKFRNKPVCPTDKSKIINNDYDFENKNGSLIQRINKSQPDILFVAFGAPKQEKWIYKNLKKMPSVKLAMGVGGSFDFISGKIKRAPLVFQKLGLEWLWRLMMEPRRIGRIYNATVKFTWLVWKKLAKVFIC